MYVDMVSILKRFIKAERAGKWMEHLAEIQHMLPYIVAAKAHQRHVVFAFIPEGNERSRIETPCRLQQLHQRSLHGPPYRGAI